MREVASCEVSKYIEHIETLDIRIVHLAYVWLVSRAGSATVYQNDLCNGCTNMCTGMLVN